MSNINLPTIEHVEEYGNPYFDGYTGDNSVVSSGRIVPPPERRPIVSTNELTGQQRTGFAIGEESKDDTGRTTVLVEWENSPQAGPAIQKLGECGIFTMSYIETEQ